MAGGGVLPEPGRRLPGVHGQDGAAGGKRPGHSVSPAGPAMGPGEERGLDPPAGFTVQQPAPSGGGAAWGTAGTRPSAPGLGERLPLLRRAEGPGGVQRPGDPVPRAGPDVGPCPERSLDPDHGQPREATRRCGGGARRITCGKPWSTPAPATNAAAVRCVPGRVSQKNLGRYQVPLVPGGAEKAPE